MVSVINVRGKNKDELEADPGFVYVGRAVQWTKWKRSFWGNPFTVRQHGHEAAVRLFEHWLYETEAGRLRLDRLHELRGKTLGCWCVDWSGEGEPKRPCHAVVLARIVDSLEGA